MDGETEASRGWDLPGLTQGWSVWSTALCQPPDVLRWDDLPHHSPALIPLQGYRKEATPLPHGWEEERLAGKGPRGGTPDSGWEGVHTHMQPFPAQDPG